VGPLDIQSSLEAPAGIGFGRGAGCIDDLEIRGRRSREEELGRENLQIAERCGVVIGVDNGDRLRTARRGREGRISRTATDVR